MVQYADEIAIWLNTSLRKHTNKRTLLYLQACQSELNKSNLYMKENGLELSADKTCLTMFNCGENLKRLQF